MSAAGEFDMVSMPMDPQLEAAFEVSFTKQSHGIQEPSCAFHQPSVGPLPASLGEPGTLTLGESTVQIRVLAADGLSDLVAMGTASRWKRIRYGKL